MVYLSCQPSDATDKRVNLLGAILMTHNQGSISGDFLDFVIILETGHISNILWDTS
jgi:hypothetical protein